jgi:D-glycero-D-manno-heptose 1,7-bisphosphate phosphatase
VFLDRDGVLNAAVVADGKPHPPANLAQLRVMPQASAALAHLKAAGFLLICVTNQPDVGGECSREKRSPPSTCG